jgi:hypothetical protein
MPTKTTVKDAVKKDEIEWLSGKHQWVGSYCLICHLRRDQPELNSPVVYTVDGYYEVVPPPCVSRLASQPEGLWTTTQVCEILDTPRANFTNLLTLGLTETVPAAVLVHGNVYLWRFGQIEQFKKLLGTGPIGKRARRTDRVGP